MTKKEEEASVVQERLRIAFLTTDNREHSKDYSNSQPYFGTAPEALIEGFKTMAKDVEIHVVSCLQKTPISSPKKLADNIYYHALHVPKIGWMKTGYLGCIRAVRRKLQEIQPDIVHGQGTERDCSMCAVFSGFPNVLTIHGNIAELARIHSAIPGSFAWLQARLEDLCLARTTGVFCNSAYTESLVAHRTRQSWRVPNPLRSRFFESTQSTVGEDVSVLNVGVICPRKRQVELLDMASEIHDARTNNLKWRFIGHLDASTAYGRLFLDRLRKAKSAGYAEHAGVLDTDALIQAMDQARALVHFPYEEAFGLVVAEAMARGLKFFGSDLGGIRDIAAGVSEAELIPAKNFHELGNRMLLWLDAGAPRAPHAAQTMGERYLPLKVGEEHLQIYHGILAGQLHRGASTISPTSTTP